MDDTQFLKVTHADYVGGRTIRMTFNNGAVRQLDFTPLMQTGICTKLQDDNYFRNFTLDPYTIDWNNEIGFAPEFLYSKSTPVRAQA